jgi:TPR repeat protein
MTSAIRKAVSRLAPIAFLAAAWAFAGAAQAQPASNKGLHPQPSAAVLDDPIVKQCRMLAARRMDPKLDSLTTAVEKAAMIFKVQDVFDAVATCRAALARYPNEPKIIIAEYNASETLSVLALGMHFPDSEEQALNMVLEAIRKEKANGMVKQMYGFYIGSAFEYGIGTKPNLGVAMRWYSEAAAAGDPISKRELARLQSTKQ